MREVIATGKTVEEATENGCRELGLSRDEVSVEILEMPQKKLFKTLPARVKVTADGVDDAEAPVQAQPEVAAAPKAAPVAEATAATPQQEPAQKQEPAKPAPKVDKGQLLPVEPEEQIDPAASPRVAMAIAYLQSIIGAAGAQDVSVTAYRQGDATLLRVDGGNINDTMEIRGETIQALSYLIDRAVNAGVDKKEDEYLRIRLDIAGYRNRRERELLALAERTGKEVARTGRSRTLAPMNPYERLIVHTAISSMEGVTSESIGADTERRVVVKSTGPNATDGDDWRPGRGSGYNNRDRQRRDGDRREGGRGRGGRGGGRQGGRSEGSYRSEERASSTPQREYADRERDPNAAPVVPEQREAIRDGEDLPLYGKIEL